MKKMDYLTSRKSDMGRKRPGKPIKYDYNRHHLQLAGSCCRNSPEGPATNHQTRRSDEVYASFRQWY